MTTRFLVRTNASQKWWSNIFKLLKEKPCQPTILYLAKLFFQNEGKDFFRQKSKEFITTRPIMQVMGKKTVQTEGKWYHKEIEIDHQIKHRVPSQVLISDKEQINFLGKYVPNIVWDKVILNNFRGLSDMQVYQESCFCFCFCLIWQIY